MIYHLLANVTFEADDIDDALNKLQEHFLSLCEPKGGYDFLEFLPGSTLSVEVKPHEA